MEKVKFWLNEIRYSKPVRTAAQAAIALVSTNTVGVLDVDWVEVATVSGLAAVVSILMALADGSSLSGRPANE